jgi:NADH dehydrogenase/NADH:ubiquinone oxidoreductase subunit G
MSRYSDEQREAILAETRATLERARAEREEPAAYAMVDDDPEDAAAVLAAALARPVESGLDRWRREAREQEARFARERAQRERDARPAPVDWTAIDRHIADAVEAAVDAEREYQREFLAHVVAELRNEGSEAVERATATLNAEVAEARVAVAELRLALATSASAKSSDAVLDLPAWPRRAKVVN